MSNPIKQAITGSTQEHLPIEDVVDGIVLMKDGSAAVVLQVSSVNFDLLSEREQQSMVFAYGGILNSLNFPIQIVIRSNTKDVSTYVNKLKGMETEQNNPLLKERIGLYRKFIEETVKKNDVLSKSFYVAIPFSTLELGIKSAQKNITQSLVPRINKSEKKELPFEKELILEKAKASLEPKKEHLSRLFSRLGLEVKVLSTKELIELYYKIYNEESSSNQKINDFSFETPIVSAKI